MSETIYGLETPFLAKIQNPVTSSPRKNKSPTHPRQHVIVLYLEETHLTHRTDAAHRPRGGCVFRSYS